MADKVRRYTANLRNDYKLAENLDLGVQLIEVTTGSEAPGSLSAGVIRWKAPMIGISILIHLAML